MEILALVFYFTQPLGSGFTNRTEDETAIKKGAASFCELAAFYFEIAVDKMTRPSYNSTNDAFVIIKKGRRYSLRRLRYAPSPQRKTT